MSKKFSAVSRILLTCLFLFSVLCAAPASARPISAPAVTGDELWGSYLTGTNGAVFRGHRQRQ